MLVCCVVFLSIVSLLQTFLVSINFVSVTVEHPCLCFVSADFCQFMWFDEDLWPIHVEIHTNPTLCSCDYRSFV